MKGFSLSLPSLLAFRFYQFCFLSEYASLISWSFLPQRCNSGESHLYDSLQLSPLHDSSASVCIFREADSKKKLNMQEEMP
jgi:hypothetical protein